MSTTLSPSPANSLFSAIRPGSRVTIVNERGVQSTGRCVMKFPTHAVLNMGGPHGTPAIATDTNTCNVVAARGSRKAAALG